MINIVFGISNPFSNRFKPVYCKSFKLTTHKFCEVEIIKDNDIISAQVRYTARQDHAGLYVAAGLFGWACSIEICDHRHWDSINNKWQSGVEE